MILHNGMYIVIITAVEASSGGQNDVTLINRQNIFLNEFLFFGLFKNMSSVLQIENRKQRKADLLDKVRRNLPQEEAQVQHIVSN